ncbi:sulfite exporter TauE/SafE family protein [Parasedimentitalea marina]|uniref:sulfite exporter TauE/SafE family protein n=1 Tax=Parasedimentitalea marina TaxID=2483033 RepID=UPI0030844063
MSAALETPGLAWLLLTISVAGLVRGFTGFGTAMIFVPIGAQFLPTADVVFLMATTGVFSTAALFPSAWKQADKSEVGALAMAAGITVPIGIWMMMQLDGLVLRWLVSVVIGVTLVVVITGWRWQGKIGWPGRFAIGGAAGTVGGMTGLTGPVVIVFYLANVRDVSRVRANTIVFLAALDVVIVTNLVFGGFAGMETLMVALMLSLPYLITTLIGKALFDPKLEKIYRVASYSVIGLAVLTSLPLFD